MSRIVCANSKVVLPKLQADSFDLLCTDPPYGINFMSGRIKWDKALPNKKIWKECLRVLKPGAFAFVMCIPRADCLWRMMRDLELAGFIIKFSSMWWAFAQGFPKAQNIGKVIEKRYRKPDKVIEVDGCGGMKDSKGYNTTKQHFIYDKFENSKAKELDGSYAGSQPKPAVEVIIVAMKPLSEKSYVEQALKNRKGITWLDDCRIPIGSEAERQAIESQVQGYNKSYGEAEPGTALVGSVDGGLHTKEWRMSGKQNPGRFPANLLVSDDVLNDGKITKSTAKRIDKNPATGLGLESIFVSRTTANARVGQKRFYANDSGSFSRYFDIDIWFQEMLKKRLGKRFERATKTFPFLLVPKASKSEKWFYCRVCKSTQEASKEKEHHEHICWCRDCQKMISQKRMQQCRKKKHKLVSNLIYHPTVKPLKLMAYLITLGSREGDKILDPFAGTCKTAMACKILNRTYVMIDSDKIALMLGKAGLKALENPSLRKKLLKRIE